MTASLLLLALAAETAPDIVVTGRGLGRSAGDAAYDEVVLPRDALTGAASPALDQILKQVPGFQLFRRSDARSANPTSQGATLRALGGNASSRALLLLDGVPQSDPFGGWINWPAYRPARLGEIRVTRGGGSGVDGPGALAGTIQLSSAAPAELRGLTGALAVGSRESLELDAGGGTALGAGFLSLSGSYAQGEGFVPVIAAQRGPVDRASPYRSYSAAARAVVPAGGAELQASGLVFGDERARGLPFTDNRTIGADLSLRLVAPRWSLLGYVQSRDFTNSFAGANAARTSASRVAEQYSVPSTGLGARGEWRPALGPVELRLGSDLRHVTGVTRERFNFQGGIGTRNRNAGGDALTVGGFAEATWQPGDFVVTGGARLDRWRISGGFLAERVFATGAVLTDTRFGDRSGWEPTARAGIAWRPGGAVTLRAAGYLGWRLPTLNELYRPFRVGPDATAANADLAPERLRGVEAGAELRGPASARLGVTLFANRLDNAIANVTLGRGPGQFPGVGFVAPGGLYSRRDNLDAVVSRGIELEGRLPVGAFTLAAGYSYADAEVSADGPAAGLDGRRPAQTPRHSASGELGWQSAAGARASLALRYVGSQFEDDLETQLLPDALTVDAAARLPLGRRLSFELRGENLADARVVAGVSGDGIVERATPRTFWIGVRLAN